MRRLSGKNQVNSWNLRQLLEEEEGILESCDECNGLILSFETLNNSHLTFDGKVLCKKCMEEYWQNYE